MNIQKDQYKVVPRGNCAEFNIYNFYFPEEKQKFEKEMKKYSSQDEMLELVIRTKPTKKVWFNKKEQINPIDSIIQGKLFKIKSFEYLPVLLDGYKVIKTPVVVEMASEKLKVSVGKNRLKNIR